MRQKAIAFLEPLAVFTLVILLIRVISAAPWAQGIQEILQRYLFYMPLWIVLLMVWIMKRGNGSDYGLSLNALKGQLKIAAIGVAPMFAVALALYCLNWKRWEQACLVAMIEIGVLFLIARLVRGQPTLQAMLIVGLGVMPSAMLLSTIEGPSVILRWVHSLVFVAFGEEVLFRGYIQSHLNKIFGAPYQFGGVNWGWGIVLTSLLFGLWHVVNPWNPFLGKWDLAWPWGLWTFFMGLILGYVREKSGGVWAPTILHAVINL